MEGEGEEEQPRSPFWIQTTTNVSRIHGYRRRFSSLFFNSFVLIIFLLLFAVLSMVFIIPYLIHFSSHIFKPNLVKRSWNSINLLLVLIALVFGFLSRNINNDEKLSLDNGFDRSEAELPAGAPIMYDFQDQSMSSVIGLRKQKTSSSYPDLRELSPPWDHRAVDPWRFSDDTHLNYYRVLESNRGYFRQRNHIGYNLENQDPAPLPVTPAEGLYIPPPQPRSPPSLLPQSVKRKTKREYHNVATYEEERSSGSGTGKMLSPGTELSEQKGGRGERKRGNGEKRRASSSEPGRISSPVKYRAPEPLSPPPVSPSPERKRNGGSATKDFFTSFYHKKKKKQQRERSADNLGALLHHSQPPAAKSPAIKNKPPPPPPPPLPPPVRYNMFPTKKENRKKFISVTLPPPSPPPPPPPPPPSITNRMPRPHITRVAPFVTEKPRSPLMINGFNGIDDSSSGGESPMKQIPPPPPPPPFKMPDWKFAVEGDFVRLQSTLSSRSVSPEARSPSSDVDDAAAAAAALFCLSPDVDTKADSFIARFRAGLKLERMSKLGPGPISGPSDS